MASPSVYTQQEETHPSSDTFCLSRLFTQPAPRARAPVFRGIDARRRRGARHINVDFSPYQRTRSCSSSSICSSWLGSQLT